MNTIPKTLLLFIFFTCCLAPRPCLAESDYSRLSKVLETDPENGIAATKAFLDAHPDTSLITRTNLQRKIALAYFQLKDVKSAMAVLDAEMAELRQTQPGKDRTRAWASMVYARENILYKTRQYQQVVELVDKNLPELLPASDNMLRKILSIYDSSLTLSKQDFKMVSTMQRMLAARPELTAEPWIMGQLVSGLINKGEKKAALHYARLSWMVCPFNAGSISSTTNQLSAAWMANGYDVTKSMTFNMAQKNATAPNPLTEIKLPDLDEPALAAAVANLPLDQVEERVTLLLMQGKMHDAMMVARRGLLEYPAADNSGAVLEIARVFKAADLNLVRANAFLQYLKTGKGVNPLEVFFMQYPAEG